MKKEDVISFMQYSSGYGIHLGRGRSKIIFLYVSHLVVYMVFWDEVPLTLSHWSCCFTAFKSFGQRNEIL